MYIRFPFFEAGRQPMRYIHYTAMTIVTINLIWRFWYAFFSKHRDYKEFALGRKDLEVLPKALMYYSFIKDSYPHVFKYNPMQKGTYSGFGVMMLFQAFTGFSLLFPNFLLGWWAAPLVGGQATAESYARIIHYILNWLFIVMTTAHAYLSIMEDYPALKFFFFLSKHLLHEEEAEHEEPAVRKEPAAAAEMVEPMPAGYPGKPKPVMNFENLRQAVSQGKEAAPEAAKEKMEELTAETLVAILKNLNALNDRISGLEKSVSGKDTYKEEEEYEDVPEEERCRSRTRTGERCKRRARPGSKYCGLHQY